MLHHWQQEVVIRQADSSRDKHSKVAEANEQQRLLRYPGPNVSLVYAWSTPLCGAWYLARQIQNILRAKAASDIVSRVQRLSIMAACVFLSPHRHEIGRIRSLNLQLTFRPLRRLQRLCAETSFKASLQPSNPAEAEALRERSLRSLNTVFQPNGSRGEQYIGSVDLTECVIVTQRSSQIKNVQRIVHRP